MKEYLFNVLIAIDQLIGTVIFGNDPDETISSMVGRKYPNTILEKIINTLFFWDPSHCKEINKGQINVLIAIIGAVGMIGASIFTSWATTSNKISNTEMEIKIIEERENNHYAQVQLQLEEMNKILRAAPWNKSI